MIALLIAMMIVQEASIQHENAPQQQIVHELIVFPDVSNRDLVVSFGYFGPLVTMDPKLTRSIMAFRNNNTIHRQLIGMLRDPEKYAVAQVILVHFFGWDKEAIEDIPGVFGLDLQYEKDLSSLFSKKRADALQLFWEREIGSRYNVFAHGQLTDRLGFPC